MVERYNEGKAIDAVLRRIEAREKAFRRKGGYSPDDMADPDPERRVEYVCTVGDQTYAFEHTGIEPFSNQIEMDVHNANFFGPVIKRFDNRSSDAELWELCYPIEACVGLSGPKINKARDALVRWIETTAASTPLARYGDKYANRFLGETVPDVPFHLSLHRWSFNDFTTARNPLSGRFCVRPFVAGDLESARLIRLKKVCEDKFLKLAKWKRDGGVKTVLVLEENDISLTNHQLVADSMALAEAGNSIAADEMFLVSTSIPDKWYVTCLRRAGKTYYDSGERFYEIDPACLTRLTRR
jgi:hypothetical protein